MRYLLLILFLSCCSFSIFCQSAERDTLEIPEVSIKAYFSKQTLSSAPTSATVVDETQIEQSAVESLLPVFNAVSGVRMEERSPGSYRLSIRGSLLRSPFGVRNIKVYLDDFPLTDAGGNTYFNLIDQSIIDELEILKGPDGSLFGANSGGVVLLNTNENKDETATNVETGSYGYFRQNINFNRKKEKLSYTINQAFQKSEGYRDHSAMQRFFLHTAEKWDYADKAQLRFSGFFSNLNYETPGGLTKEQFIDDPSQSRPATNFTPSAEEQQAGISNQTLFGGLAHDFNLSNSLKHVVGISGTVTDFENPFITNYEIRKEKSIATRPILEWKNPLSNFINMQLNIGWEYQRTSADIHNYENNKGERGNIMAADRITNNQHVFFSRLAMNFGVHWKAEASLSSNIFSFSYENLDAFPQVESDKKFDYEWMPRLAISHLFKNGMALRAIFSKGFSPPTTAEIRASDAEINPFLQAEKGWNRELGFRYSSTSTKFYLDVAVFQYELEDAIVRRVSPLDQDYFVNAGGTKQNGVEVEGNYTFLDKQGGLFRRVILRTAFTYNDFTFAQYQVEDEDHSGNMLTSVPEKSWSSSISVDLGSNFNLFVQHQYVSSIPLNDANSVFADEYHLLQSKLSYSVDKQQKLRIYFGVNNALDEVYSLGNDINAFGDRYFNAAAPRNFYGGLAIQL